MNKNQKKQAPKKRAYKKKASKWSKEDSKNAIRNLEYIEPVPKPEDKDMEIAELTQICSIFTNWSADQKSRNLKYLCAKFYDFL